MKAQESCRASSDTETKIIGTFAKVPEWDHCHRFFNHNFHAMFPKGYQIVQIFLPVMMVLTCFIIL